MKPGKVSQTVFRRSVLKKLNTKVCTPLSGQEILSCDVSLYGSQKDLCVFAIARAANELAAQGAGIQGVSLKVLLPQSSREAELAAMMAEAAAAAKAQGITIHCADAEVVPVITVPVVHVTALGIFLPNLLRCGNTAKAEEDIVLIKWIGMEGTLRIKGEREKELSGRFIPSFLGQIDSFKDLLFSVQEIEAADAVGVSAIHQITDGGILAALWNLAEKAGIGLCVDLKKMSVRQETIEVCEYFHLNPYQLTSAGAFLAVTPKGDELADALTQQGMQAVVLGRTQKGNEKVIYNGGEKRYLDRPAPDELIKMFGGN